MYSVKAVATGNESWEPRTTGDGPREIPGKEKAKRRGTEILHCVLFSLPPCVQAHLHKRPRGTACLRHRGDTHTMSRLGGREEGPFCQASRTVRGR